MTIFESARSEEHILAMIARITSPIPGPSSHGHKQRRKTFRVVARGVMFIQRIKYVLFIVLHPDVPHL